MKNQIALPIFIAALSLAGCGGSELDFRNAQVSNGKIYKNNEDKSHSGLLTNIPESTIRLAEGFNGLLIEYNKGMEESNSTENRIIGRYLVCNSEINDGYLSGLLTCYKPNSTTKRYTAQYDAGKLNGEARIFASDGATLLAKGNFTNDLREGKSEVYGPNTSKLIGEYNFATGKAEGEQTSWNEKTEKMTYHVTIKNGSYVGTMRLWTAEGVPTAEVPFLNGMKNGLVKTWHENGKPMNFVTMVDGYRDGPSHTWDEDGKLTSSGTYRREVWWPEETSKTKGAAMASTGDDSCSIRWIDAFHKENGEDSMITSDQLGEWDQWCTEGRLPN